MRQRVESIGATAIWRKSGISVSSHCSLSRVRNEIPKNIESWPKNQAGWAREEKAKDTHVPHGLPRCGWPRLSSVSDLDVEGHGTFLCKVKRPAVMGVRDSKS